MPDTWVALGVKMARRTSFDAGQKSRSGGSGRKSMVKCFA